MHYSNSHKLLIITSILANFCSVCSAELSKDVLTEISKFTLKQDADSPEEVFTSLDELRSKDKKELQASDDHIKKFLRDHKIPIGDKETSYQAYKKYISDQIFLPQVTNQEQQITIHEGTKATIDEKVTEAIKSGYTEWLFAHKKELQTYYDSIKDNSNLIKEVFIGPLNKAVADNNMKMLKALLQVVTQLNDTAPSHTKKLSGNATPLQVALAVDNKNSAMIDTLIKKGARLKESPDTLTKLSADFVKKYTRTTHDANAIKNDIEVLCSLIPAFSLEATNYANETALQILARSPFSQQALECLLKADANTQRKDREWHTPLLDYMEYSDKPTAEMVQLFLEKKSDPEASFIISSKGGKKITALTIAQSRLAKDTNNQELKKIVELLSQKKSIFPPTISLKNSIQ
jgi:hypothetical protein